MFDCLVCSPPYAERAVEKNTAGIHKDKQWNTYREQGGRQSFKAFCATQEKHSGGYGTSEGQLGAMKPGSPCETPMNEVETLSWDKDTCYGASWQGLITPESFAHPAKMARGQLFRLIRWLFETGRVKKGDVLCDPFGGVSTTAIAGASAGLKVITCELEPKFHALALENMEIHRRVWEAAGDPQPVILCGDSRKLAEVAGPVLAQCCVSSPPYAESLTQGNKQDGYDYTRYGGGGQLAGGQRYGHTPGNLGNLPPGDALASGVVSSPPWADVEPFSDKKFSKCEGRYADQGEKVSYESRGFLGAAPENLARCRAGSSETFWSAARTILQQCHLLLKPGATTAWVCKAYVKAGAIVPFPDQWAALLESTGFRVTHRIRCHLVSETREADLFGGETVKRTKKVSFFRRLHEKKRPDLAIDFEEIVVAVKVGEGGSAGAVVSSPPWSGVLQDHDTAENYEKLQAAVVRDGKGHGGKAGPSVGQHYGRTAGQLGGMRPGDAP